MKKHYLLLFAVFAMCFSCKPSEPDCNCGNTPTDSIPSDSIPVDTIPTDTIPKDTIPVDTTIVDTAFVFHHLQSRLTKAQPMTGLVLWVYNATDLDAKYRKSISMEFAYCLPCKVVKGKSDGAIIYDWSSFDAMLDDIASREHQAIVRFRYEYPSGTEVDGKKGTTAVPDYIKALPDYKETYNSNAGGDGPTYYADWSNAELQWFTKQFYTDFCARYSHDPRLAFLEVGFGHWSEYHIYGTSLKFGVNFPTKQYQEEFFYHMSSVCDGLPWCVSIDAADEEYSPVPNNSGLLGLRFGLFDDSFMHKGHEIGSSGDGWNEQLWRVIDNGRWQTSPCGGEVSYYTESDQLNFLNPSGMYGVTWEQAAAKYHITFMNSNDATRGQYGTAARFLEAAHASGYRFAITELKSRGGIVYLRIANHGVAPIYRPAFVEVSGVRNSYDLTRLLPNESVELQFPIEGDNIDIHIVSDYTISEIEFEAEI